MGEKPNSRARSLAAAQVSVHDPLAATWVRFELDAQGKVAGVSIEDLAEFAPLRTP